MDWQKKVSLWWAKNFRPLVVALLVGCGVHYTIYANQLGTMDAVHIGALYIADGWPEHLYWDCLLYTSPSPRDMRRSRMPSSA